MISGYDAVKENPTKLNDMNDFQKQGYLYVPRLIDTSEIGKKGCGIFFFSSMTSLNLIPKVGKKKER